MYTTFIVDEVGNRKIVMDWFKSTQPTFGWSEVSVESLLESHPNHTAGLEFAYYYTGDDYRPQSDVYVGAEYGLLPDFRAPDLPAPRTPLERRGNHTRTSEERTSVPVRYAVKEVGSRAQPRVRCGLCAWNLGLPSEWSGLGPEQNSPPPVAETSDHLSRVLNQLIKTGRTSRRRLAESLSHKKRWALVDRWCHATVGQNLPASPSEAQLEELLSAIDDAPSQSLKDAVEHDREHRARETATLRWRALRRYHSWAEVIQTDDGAWYRHLHCGRMTHDLEEVTELPKIVRIVAPDGPIEAVLERWSWGEMRWSSLALLRTEMSASPEHLAESARSAMGLSDEVSLSYTSTDRFLFITGMEAVVPGPEDDQA